MSWLIELKELDNLKIIENVMHSSLINRMYAMFSCSVVSDSATNPMDRSPPGSSVHGDSPGKNIGVGHRALWLPSLLLF